MIPLSVALTVWLPLFFVLFSLPGRRSAAEVAIQWTAAVLALSYHWPVIARLAQAPSVALYAVGLAPYALSSVTIYLAVKHLLHRSTRIAVWIAITVGVLLAEPAGVCALFRTGFVSEGL